MEGFLWTRYWQNGHAKRHQNSLQVKPRLKDSSHCIVRCTMKKLFTIWNGTSLCCHETTINGRWLINLMSSITNNSSLCTAAPPLKQKSLFFLGEERLYSGYLVSCWIFYSFIYLLVSFIFMVGVMTQRFLPTQYM